MTTKAKRASSARARKLKARGWKSGTVSEFLGLNAEEAELVEMKLSLSDAIRESRKRRGITQVALAERLDSSQSRVAKLETGAPGVSLDLLVRAALATGSTRAEVGAVLGRTAK